MNAVDEATIGPESQKLCCPLCRSAAVNTVEASARDYLTGDEFDIVRCRECEVAWTHPFPTTLSRHYPAVYRRYSRPVLGILRWLYRRRAERWSTLFRRPGSVLELGCGDGYMLDALRDLGWNVAGTERNEAMARHARDHLGITVYVDGDDRLPDQEFDLVVMFQVLEHLPHPLDVLRRCASLLSRDGKVVVGVPNFDSWQRSYGRSGWFHLDPPRHLFHYSPGALIRAAERCGLRVSDVGFVSLEHDPYGWTQTILNRVLGNNNRLTALLMGSVPPRWTDVGLVATTGALLVPSVVLAMASWLFRRGALMEVVFSRDRELGAGGPGG
jgi:SAM-dependent methyltransferase